MATRFGHGGGLSVRDPKAPKMDSLVEGVSGQYFKERNEIMQQRFAKNQARVSGFNAMFPNFSINSSADLIHLWHPRGPLRTESWVYSLVDKGAPPDIKNMLRMKNQRHFGPTGMFEEDDSDNWRLSTAGCASVIGRRYPLNYSLSKIETVK